MRRLKDYPENLRPYVFHGLELDWREGDKQAVADCPWCGREGKYSINVATGKSRCWGCKSDGKKGGSNPILFIRQLWEESDKATKPDSYALLAKQKGLNPESLMRWGVCKSVLDGSWLVPSYGPDSSLCQLGRYVPVRGGKRILLMTPGLSAGVFGLPFFDPEKSTLYVCEGCWDAIALADALATTKQTDDGLKNTANASISLLSNANVLGIPGNSYPFDRYAKQYKGKKVWLMFDSDHPKQGKAPAGFDGASRLASKMSGASSVGYLHWGEAGYDPELADGYDVRDCLQGENT